MAFKLSEEDDNAFEDFLERLGDVETLVNDLTSGDDEKQAAAIARADKVLAQDITTVQDRTVVNKDAYKSDVSGPTMSQDAFMAALESDAQKRAILRKERYKKADEMKEKANVAFKDGNYETALWLYSEGIEVVKDMPVLYTNRAMTNIKIERFDDAIEDCNMALRIDPKWIKAFVTKGNALRCLQKYDEAIACYKKILTIDKDKEKMVSEYVHKAEEEKRVEGLEKMAKLSLEENSPAAENVVKVIRSVATRLEVRHETPENMFTYYAGGFRVIAAQLVDEPSRTLFRTQGGFKILEAKPYLRECLMKRAFAFGRQSDFACSFLMTIRAACCSCPENTLALFKEPLMPEIMLNLLESGDKQVKNGAVLSFFEFAYNDQTVEMICKQYTAPKFVKLLMNKDTLDLKLVSEAVSCVSRYANCKTFLQDLVQAFNSLVLQVFHKFLDEISHNQRKVLPQCLECLYKCALNKFIRQMVATNHQFWESCLTCIDRCVHIMERNRYRNEVLLRMLDLVENLILHDSHSTTEIAPRLAKTVLPLLNNGETFQFVTKTLVVLTRTLERARETAKVLHSSSGLVFIKKIYKIMNSEHISARTHALKVIAYCAQVDPTLLRNARKFDKKYSIIRRLLDTDKEEIDLINQGHAAILLGYISQLPGGMDPIIEADETSNVVKQMLTLVRESRSNNTQYNCAIALGKMANNDDRILGELRRLDGINILAKHKPPHGFM